MGTHPIFESDFDCLTDLVKTDMARNSVTAGGIPKHSRSKMYSRRAQHKRTKTVTKAEKKAASAVTEKTVGGAKNGRCRKTAKILSNTFYQKKSSRSRPKAIQPTCQIIEIKHQTWYRFDFVGWCCPW